MGRAYALGGTPALILLKMGVLGAALIVLWRRVRGCTPIIATTVLSLAIVCVIPTSLTVRPQLWSVLGLVLLLALIDREEPPGAMQSAAGAVLFAFWANLHGGWITGAAVLALYVGVRLLRDHRQAGPWAIFAFASAAGTVANPYGLGLWRFLAGTVRASRPDISEWGSLGFQSPIILWIPLISTLFLALVLSRRAESRPRTEVWAVLLLLAGGAIRVLRIAPLMAPAVLVLLAPGICCAWGDKGRLTVTGRPAAAIFWIPVMIAVAAAVTPVTQAFACLPITGAWRPDVRAAAYLRDANGRLLTTFDWGEYAIWHFGPRLRVSVDGRRETVYSDAVVQWHRAFEKGDADAQRIVADLAPDYVWLPSSTTVAKAWLVAAGYRIDADTGSSFVAVKHDLPQLKAPQKPNSGCFP